VVSSTPRPHFTPGKDPVPILQEAGWAQGTVWTGGKSRPHRDTIPDRPAHSSSSKHKILLRFGLYYLLASVFHPNFPLSAHRDARYVALPRSKGPQFAVIQKLDVIAEICERYRRSNILVGGSNHIACLECVVTPVG